MDTPARFLGGARYPFMYSETNKSQLRNIFAGGVPQKGGLNVGALPPSSWVIPQKSGLIASFTGINGSSAFSGILALAITTSASFSGSSSLNATGFVSANISSSVSGSSSLSGSASILLFGSATMSGTSSFTSSVVAVGNIDCTSNGSSSVSSTIRASGSIDCEISNQTEFSPDNLAGAVWSAVATEYNISGTMGEKLNSAGGSNSPTDIADAVWNAIKTDYSDTDSMGLLVQEISEELSKRLKKTDFIALK